uniref:Reverse transcriptase zinc-binding domain-containing protein n=1 Tax=Tanacetum cinerariifolium TaxID=118510 RepID=A0A6L2J534_TANCI|nr:hypothetical protein [Tanacetum cinerariifolium]
MEKGNDASSGLGTTNLLQSIKANVLASKESKERIMPRRYTTYQEPLKEKSSSKATVNDGPSLSTNTRVDNSSTDESCVNTKSNDGTGKLDDAVNYADSTEVAEGAAVAIPIAAAEEVKSHFANTLYGYCIGKRLAFPLAENYTPNIDLKKEEIKFAPIWVKLHHVPIVAYLEVGISLIATQIGKPIMMDSYTSNMCLSSWGRSTYARVLVEVSAESDLMESIVVAIPMSNGKGHTFALVDIKYEWKPPRCSTCKIFDHENDKCPKNPKVVVLAAAKDDGFVEVKRKKNKDVKTTNGVVFTSNNVALNNSFSSLGDNDNETDWEGESNKGNVLNESHSEDIEEIIMEELNAMNTCGKTSIGQALSLIWFLMINIASWNVRGMNFSPKQSEIRHVISENSLSICAILESHVVESNLVKICSRVFRHWDWTSNGGSCLKDSSAGSSNIDISMHEFKECVEEIEVLDVQRSGLQFTWNQKPKGKEGLLKKIDRIMANLDFIDSFVGVHAVFKPYRILDHAPSVLNISTRVHPKPRPFKFFNLLTRSERFKEVVVNGWSIQARSAVAFNEELLMEECFLKQKAKIEWLKEGDTNSAYFYKAVKSQISRSRIDVITSDDGTIYENDQVADLFVSYYEQFLGIAGNSNGVNIDGLFMNVLADHHGLDQIRSVTTCEVKDAMFSMGNDKAPGPDGYTVSFFKESWDIIGDDVTKVVGEFFTNGTMLKELNHTNIALVPKVSTPSRVNDYRPISCCNVLYKCVSKIIANHIKGCLELIVSVNQSAFVPGRSIADNILLIQELMHNYHLDRGPARVRDTSMFTYHRYCSDLELVNLCFADDLFLFIYGDVDSATIIKDVLDEFKDASGLAPRLPKSKAYFCNVLNHNNISILGVLPFEEGRLLVKYLGVPFVASRLIFRDYKELVERVQSPVQYWKNKSLSVASRVQLVQSVIGSMHVYWASVFILPSRVLYDLEQIMRGFLWCQGNMRRGKAKVAWEVVFLPKDEGGLGIRRLDLFNKALMVTHIWKLLSSRNALADDISSRDMYRAGLDHSAKVRDVVLNGSWNWPSYLLGKYTFLGTMAVLNIVEGAHDLFEWRDGHGRVKNFSVSQVWSTIRYRSDKVNWYSVVWFLNCIPRHAFNLWLIIKQRLKTQDKVCSWDVSDALANVCSLCEMQPDSHEHLFFDCPYYQQVWSHLKCFAGLNTTRPTFSHILDTLVPFTGRKSSRSVIAKLVVAVVAYYVWQERNHRLFKSCKRNANQLIKCVKVSIRLKLLSCRFKKSKEGSRFAHLWDLTNSCFC